MSGRYRPMAAERCMRPGAIAYHFLVFAIAATAFGVGLAAFLEGKTIRHDTDHATADILLQQTITTSQQTQIDNIVISLATKANVTEPDFPECTQHIDLFTPIGNPTRQWCMETTDTPMDSGGEIFGPTGVNATFVRLSREVASVTIPAMACWSLPGWIDTSGGPTTPVWDGPLSGWAVGWAWKTINDTTATDRPYGEDGLLKTGHFSKTGVGQGRALLVGRKGTVYDNRAGGNDPDELQVQWAEAQATSTGSFAAYTGETTGDEPLVLGTIKFAFLLSDPTKDPCESPAVASGIVQDV